MSKVLLLNASWEPLCVITMKRAFGLVFSDKVDVVCEDAGVEICSSSASFPSPKVLRLRYYIALPHFRSVRPTRRNVLLRDEHQCAYCHGKATTIDHIIPRSRGGEHDWSNVVAACEACNNRKGSTLLQSLGWKLHITPKRPAHNLWVTAAARDEAIPEWTPYLQQKILV